MLDNYSLLACFERQNAILRESISLLPQIWLMLRTAFTLILSTSKSNRVDKTRFFHESHRTRCGTHALILFSVVVRSPNRAVAVLSHSV